MRVAMVLVGAFLAAVPALGQDSVLKRLGATRADLQDLKLPAPGSGPFEAEVTLRGKALTLDLSPHSVRGPGFRLLVQGDNGALTHVAAPPECTYRGSVRGEAGSIVAASLTDQGLTALVRLAGATWSIQPLSDALPGARKGVHFAVEERDVHRGPWMCGVTAPGGQAGGGGAGGGPDAFLACQIACDADFQFYTANGSSLTNTTNDISAIVNGLAAVYQADANVTFQLGTVIVRQSSTQPFTATDSNALLDQFRLDWSANQAATPRDIAHLFTGKDLDGSTIGLAYIGVVCNSTFGYGLSQSRYTTNFAYRVGVTAHEVGHNFNEGHCDSSCSPCRIMCSGIGGCTGVVTSFGCSAATIASYATGRSCLTPANNGLTLPFTDGFSSLTLDYNRWPTPGNNGGVVNTVAVNERSAPNSLNLSNTASITTAGIDLSSTGGRRAYVQFWTQHLNVEAGKTLVVSYRRPVQGDYLPLTTITSDGVNPFQFWPTEVVLPVDGQGANAMLRFTAQGNQADDAWYVDDVRVSLHCRADLNQDGALNIFDFHAYLAGLSTLTTSICDWNGDGFITVVDYNAFFNAVNAGCTGY